MPSVPFRIRSGIEIAGWLPRLMTGLGGGKQNNEGIEEFFGLPYAEYVKGDFDIAPLFTLNDRSTIAAHFAVGVAYPYGNSTVLRLRKDISAAAPTVSGDGVREHWVPAALAVTPPVMISDTGWVTSNWTSVWSIGESSRD